MGEARMALSDPLDGGFQEPDEKGRKLCRSGFNPRWFKELHLPPPTVIFDVGSFDGADALRFKRAYPDATIIAMDPDPACANRIRENVIGEGITFIEAAAIDRVGTIPLHHAGDHSERGSRCASIYQWAKKPEELLVTVAATTISKVCDSLKLSHIDLLHIDVEGAELLAIKGLGTIRPKLIWAEIWDGWIGAPGSAKTHDAIVALGYRQVTASKADRLYIHAQAR